MDNKTLRRMSVVLASLLVAVILFGCGGGGGGSSSSGTSTPDTVISGVVSKGPVDGATVRMYSITNGAKGDMIGTATTGADGSFTMNVGQHTGPMMAEVTGGSYTDEATGQTVQMGGMMIRAAATSMSGNAPMAITPFTEMAVQYMNGDYSTAMIGNGNQQVQQTFGMSNIVGVMPHNAMTQAQQGQDSSTYYGLMLGAMSQMSKDTGQSISTIMQNFANSMMTGNNAQLTADVNTMKNSYNTFNMGSKNMTGITNLQPSGMMGSGRMM